MYKHWLMVALGCWMTAASTEAYAAFCGSIRAITGPPALIPLPQKVQWSNEQFLLSSCRAIVVKDARLQKEAKALQLYLAKKVTITNGTRQQPYIELKLGNVEAPVQQQEAYQLHVTSERIQVLANTVHGVFNALQTLKQLIVHNTYIAGCTITDYPAYPWRGYMVDVGRNFQSIALLKQQIDKMANYKLNIFHFHCTEDIE